ncbi:ABC transporter permease [Flavihumibacter fluvii]|uniref:ABC transporter permease n=1 Tax=Flavihumibacter fluvii TaxID=2838157 RepID=UPI001BDE4588|nr:ABC transporter permease [Flavihumibacter fluvii]ULQ54382.1 ABC transporter permease [Flavihumibacter fluvii]
MFKNYFRIALRNLRKYKLYTIINITGLMTGLSACLLIGLYITHELSYDQFHAKKDRIARVTMEYGRSGNINTVALTGTKVGPQLKRTFPAVEAYVRTFIRSRVVKKEEKVFEESRFLYADDPFFTLFSFPLIEGDPATALNAPDKIVISQSMARKYFGQETAINKTLTIGNTDYTISGISKDVPQNSQLKFDFVTQFMNLGKDVVEENWWTANWITYLQVKDARDIPQLEKQVEAFMNTQGVRTEARLEGADFLRYKLEPLTRVHLYSPLAGFEPNGNIRYIYIFGVIAFLIVLIACANYTNLATAQSVGRSGEIGIRKVMGASRQQLFFQFIGESTTITTIAAILAFGLSIWLLPYFNTISGKAFSAEDLLQPKPVLMLSALAIAVSFLAGAYPAMVLSGNALLGVMKKGFNFTGTNSILRKSLIVLQFGISVFLIIYTLIILQQINYLQHKKLGYDKDHVLVLPVDTKMTANYATIKAAIAAVPGVEGITASYETPEFVEWGDGIRATDERGVHDVSLNAMPVDLEFTKTLGMAMIAGRDFQENDFPLMDTSNGYAHFRQPYIINESLAKKIGWTPEQAIGKTIEKNFPGPVVGVVKDFHFESLHQPVKPLVMFLDKDMARIFMVRLRGTNIPAVIARLEGVWKVRVPHRPFEYHFLDEDYNKLYIAEQRSSALFTVSGGLAILLACLGLFGLATFTTVQRKKEIGIRRILGADISNIAFLISKNFLVLVGLSILIAMPFAWYAGNEWLNAFAYRISIHAGLFIGTAAAVLLIAFLTVCFQAVKAAITNPVKSLRTE